MALSVGATQVVLVEGSVPEDDSIGLAGVQYKVLYDDTSRVITFKGKGDSTADNCDIIFHAISVEDDARKSVTGYNGNCGHDPQDGDILMTDMGDEWLGFSINAADYTPNLGMFLTVVLRQDDARNLERFFGIDSMMAPNDWAHFDGSWTNRIKIVIPTVVSIAVIPKGMAEGDVPTDVSIGAGGIQSDAHQADVIIRTTPATAGIPVTISLENGIGHATNATWVIGGVSVSGGGSAVTINTAEGGKIEGVLTSSDSLDTCILHAGNTSREVTFEWDEVEEEGEWVTDRDYLPIPGVLKNWLRLSHHRKPPADEPRAPLNGHGIRMFVEMVEYWEGGQLRALTNTPAHPSDVSEWATFPETPTPTDTNGVVRIDLHVENKPNLHSVLMVAYDWSVYRSPGTSPAPLGAVKLQAQATPAPDQRDTYLSSKCRSGQEFAPVVDLDGVDAVSGKNVLEADDDKSGVVIQPVAIAPAARLIVRSVGKSGYERFLSLSDYSKVTLRDAKGNVLAPKTPKTPKAPAPTIDIPGDSDQDATFTVTQTAAWNPGDVVIATLTVQKGNVPVGIPDTVKLVDIKVEFKERGAKYGWDDYTMTTEKAAPWAYKSVKLDDTDTVTAHVTPAAKFPDVTFESTVPARVTVSPAAIASEEVTVTGVARGQATVNAINAKAIGEVCAQFKARAYAQVEKTVAVRLVSDTQWTQSDCDIAEKAIQDKLDQVFKQAVVHFTVKKLEAMTVSFDEAGDGAGLLDLSNIKNDTLNDELNEIIKECQYAEADYNVFLVSPSNPGLNPRAPVPSITGFTRYDGRYAFVLVNSPTTVTHELGHLLGRGLLDEVEDTINIMKSPVPEKQAEARWRLRAYQWDRCNPEPGP